MESVKKVKISVPDRADQTVRSSESSETLSSEYEHSNDIDAATAADFQLIVGMMDGDDSSSNPSLRNSLSNSNSNDNEELPVKKKRGRKPNPFRTRNKSLFTRILKADIRRDYAIMFNNVVNSHEPSMLLRYLKKFAHPDMQMIGDLPDDRNILMSRLAPLQGLFDKRLPPPPGLDLSFLPPTGLDLRVMDNKFVLLGLPSSTVFLLSVQQDTPDSVGIVQDIAIKRTLFEEGCVILTTIHVRGTRLFALEDGQMTPYTPPPAVLGQPPAAGPAKIVTMELHVKVVCKVALDSNFLITRMQHEAYPLAPPQPVGFPF